MSFHKRPPVEELVEVLNTKRYVTHVADHFDASRQSVHEWIAFYREQDMMARDCQWVVIKPAEPDAPLLGARRGQ